MSQHKASEMTGNDVITEDGHDLGQVKDWVIDTETWQVTEVIVRLNRDMLETLHMKKPLMGTQEINVSTEHISGVASKVVLSKKIEDFARPTDG